MKALTYTRGAQSVFHKEPDLGRRFPRVQCVRRSKHLIIRRQKVFGKGLAYHCPHPSFPALRIGNPGWHFI